MLRAIWFLIQITALALLAVWLVDRPGTVQIQWRDYTITAQLGYVLLAVAVTVLAGIIVYRLWHAIISLPRVWGRFREKRNIAKGHQALTHSLVALAAGDYAAATAQARKSRRLIPEYEGLPLLLEAQAARMGGDDDKAAESFHALLEDKETAFLGVRGLMQGAIGKGDYDRALQFAYKARDMHPKQGWILRAVYDLEIRTRRWDCAIETAKRAKKAGGLDEDKANSDMQAIWVHRADLDLQNGYRPDAIKKLKKAYKIDPGFPPLAQRLARLYLERGKRWAAIRTIEKAWRLQPHPDLVELWNRMAPSNKPSDPMIRLRWFERLLALKPDSADGQIAVAQAAMDDGLWGEARAYLVMAEKIRPSARLYRMWAELEDLATHDDDAARAWLEKAAQVPGDKVWICHETGRIYNEWSAIAEPHGSFNTIVWADPGEVRAPAPMRPETRLGEGEEVLLLSNRI